MIGLILAAGAGRRLQPLTDSLPKTLLPVREARSILDLAVANLASIGLDKVVIVTGHAQERIAASVPGLEDAYGVELELVANPNAEGWNNAYSLWCARDAFREGALLVNGDTVHPASVEQALLGAKGDGIALAVDPNRERLTDESMKVEVTGDGMHVARLGKSLPLANAYGEYIGVAAIRPGAASLLAHSLEGTWHRDPALYYEDAFVEYARGGGDTTVVPIGGVDWVEVDDHDDLERARELACRY